jgi:hypothetical protein
MAEVKSNGRDIGILWKPPFRIEVTDVIMSGKNTLELRVLNLFREISGDLVCRQIGGRATVLLSKGARRNARAPRAGQKKFSWNSAPFPAESRPQF